MAGNFIKGSMDMRKIVLLFVLMISISSGRQLGGNSLDGMVEQILLNCGLDPMNTKSIVKDLDIIVVKGIVTGSANGGKWEAFSPPYPELKNTNLDCLSKHNFFFYDSGEHNLQYRYSEYPSFAVSRRHLEDQPNGILAPAPAPRLASAPFPSPVLAPTPSPGHADETSSSPSPSHDRAHGFSPVPTPKGSLPHLSDGPSPNKGVGTTPMGTPLENREKTSVVITAILVTMGTTILAAFLIFCCCRCLKKTYGSENGQKDDRPLLTISSSDTSGSPYNSEFSCAIKGNVGALSVKTESRLTGHIITFDGSTQSLASEVVSGVPTSTESSIASNSSVGPIPPLKPPPGRNTVSPAGPPPPAPPPPPSKPKAAPPPPVPPPPLPKAKPGPPPPPPPKAAAPRRPPQAKVSRPSPFGPNRSRDEDTDADAPKTKLKPLFWDKVSTNPEKSMVWNDIKSGSFQFNEEMIETLFGYRSDDKRKTEGGKGSMLNDHPSQYVQLLEPKKSQNLAISLKAMTIKVDEVIDALMQGNELPSEFLQTLLRMAPTTDEEMKLRLYNGDPSLLGPGEQFLKAMLNIPFAFKRMDALLFMSSLPEEVTNIKESFASLEVACKELKSSRLFLKLLEAVLKLGNRMNDGTFRGGAQAFKLDTLLKLSDVKGADGKTTLLHFVVQEIIRSEGARAVRLAKESQSNLGIGPNNQADDPSQDSEDNYRSLGLKIVSCLSTELENVKKAAGLDADALASEVGSLGHKLVETKGFLGTDMRSTEEDSGFCRLLKSFVEHAEVDITFLLEEEKRIRSMVKSTTDYFHGNSGRDEGLRLFVIVRDFLGMIDKACKEVRESQKKIVQAPRNKDSPTMRPIQDPRQHLFPAIRDRRVDSSSSDEDEQASTGIGN